jgi:hypothetical protein
VTLHKVVITGEMTDDMADIVRQLVAAQNAGTLATVVVAEVPARDRRTCPVPWRLSRRAAA